MDTRKIFRMNPVAYAVMLALGLPAAVQLAHAGAGVGSSTNSTGAPKVVATYYANSPAGTWIDWQGTVHNSGTPLRKFVDELAPLGCAAPTPTLGQCIPVAVADTATYPGSDYYEIGVVEYSEKMHSDLPKASTVRGYVQLETPATAASSKHIQLFYPDGVTPILDSAGNPIYALDKPHYMGPLISATKDRPVRIKYYNLLPTGHFDPVTGSRRGDLFLPVDTTLMGAGEGPLRDPSHQIGTKTVTLADGVTTVTQPAYEEYTQNRALFHLHGGDNPWVSDGTPHQWTTPAGETTDYQRGASFAGVPDMPDPAPGTGTLFYPNGLSGRFMFFHDHSNGITRLNVYAGEVAGYMISDPLEATLPIPGTAVADQIPLVIQDKTFVPADIAQQDAKWDTARWGQPGDLWFPHVYETNQDPTSFDGTNPVGRWDWGPWFWPVFPATYALPAVSAVPESFMDTPVVNGTAYPTITVEPKAYRFRVLNGANERFLNLSLFLAEPLTIAVTNGGTGYSATPTVTVTPSPTDTSGTTATATATVSGGVITGIAATVTGPGFTAAPTVTITDATGTGAAAVASVNTEVKMVPATPPMAGSPLQLCSTTAVPDPTTGLPPNCWPTTWPTDGRAGGVPDPTTAGPKMVEIGNEGGVLPAPAVVPANPVGYEYNRRSVTVLNVLEHALYLGPAERGDVIVDFSQYAGKTLIVYNDAPAPVPGFDPRNDYYTGDPDQTAVGGAATTLPGYGPNTRTVMQIKVAAAVTTAPTYPTTATGAFDQTALNTALPSVYAQTQPKPIVAESAYNTALGTAYPDTYAKIYTGSATQPTFNFTAGDTLTYYPLDPTTMTISTTPVTVTAGQAAQIPVLSKAIAEEFELKYGRMNATLGTEMPFTSVNIQTTVPLGYIDPATETINDGETQIWKVTHNGVDTHTVHFHLINVQVINRIGWDGTVKPPAADEVGWKDTVKMNPLEDIVVAVRAKKPTLPGFGLPRSVRALDPTQPLGTMTGFTQIDPYTNNPKTVKNVVANFGWEYVWHCHLLGHEENDFMRPVVFKVPLVAPAAPTALALTAPPALDPTTFTIPVSLSWTDNSNNEYQFRIERAVGTGAFVPVGTAPANAKTFTDTTASTGRNFQYRVAAVAAAYVTRSTPIAVTTPGAFLVAAGKLAATIGATATPTAPTQSVTLTWNDNSTNETGFVVERSDNGGTFTQVGTVAAMAGTGSSVSFTDAAALLGHTYTYRVKAIKATAPMGVSLYSNYATVTIGVPLVPTGLTASAVLSGANDVVTLKWTDNANSETGFTVQSATDANFTLGVVNTPVPANSTTLQQTVARGTPGVTTYWYRIQATNALGTSPWSDPASVVTK
jgi:FtsP/CotA-like multicopper oxidase with cupredoxin domain